MPSSQEIARVMAEMDRFNQTAKMTVTEERYEKRVASVGGSYGGLTALLQQGAPGNWASDHKSEAEKFAGWHYVAISSIGKAVRSANCEAYQEKVREYAKAYNEQDDDSEPLQKWHPLMKLLKRPNPSQSGASFREEVAIQLCLTGSALIWNVPNQMGRTVERYVIPTAIAEPRQPERGRPKGGWYINPEVARWQIESGWFLYTGLATAIGKVIDARDVQVIRFIHPVFKDEGQSPVSAGALWTDTSEKVDISRHSHLRNGSDPSVIIGIDGVEDEGTLQRMSAKFNEKYAGPSKHGKAMFVNGQNVKVEPVTRTPAEMAYEGAFVQFRDAIMALHGVTPIAAGIEAPSGDDGLYAPLKQFISGTVQPILDLMAEEDTEQLAEQFGEGISVIYTAKAVDDAKLTEQQINTDILAGAIEVDEIRKLRGRKPWGGEKGKAVAGQGAKEEAKPGLPGLAQGVPGLEPQTGSQALDPSEPPQGTPDPMKLAEEAVAKALGGFADRLSALLKSGDNCGTGAGGFKPGNDCAGGGDGGNGGDKPAKKKRGKKAAEESSDPKIEVFDRGAGELEFTSRGDLIRGKLGDLPITEGEPGLIGKLSKKTKAGIESAMTDPDILEDMKAGGIEALNVEATNYYQKKTGRKGGWTAAYSNGALSINPKTIETIEASTIQERKDGGLKRVISHEAGHGVWDTARDADKKAFAEALKKNPDIVSYVSRVVNVAANPNAFSDTGSRVVTESFAEIHALRRYNREMYDSLPEDIRNPVESARKFGLELSERRAGWADRLKPKWQKSGSDCGANAEGGGGFQPGNTCGREDGSGESGGEGKASKKKPVKKGKAKGVLAWAEEKFGDPEKAKAFADWFGESKVVDEDGNPEETAPIPVYHGTTHDFEEFDLDRANVESDMGAGHYFSSDVGDSEANYAGEGPDLTTRIEQLADQLEGEFGDEYDVDEISDRLELPSDRVQEIIDGAEDDREVAKELAREKLVGGEAKVITAYLKMEKPVVLGDPKWGKEVSRAEKGETFFDFEYDEVDADGRRPDDPDFDPDTSEIQGYKGKLADLLDAVRNQAANYNEVGDGLEDDLAELQSTAADYGGFRAGELVSRLKSMESLAYATNDDGKLVSGTIVGHALRDMGFDGIVYKDAAQHFPNFGARGDGKAIKPGTRHYVIWDSRQIKAANNQGTFDPSNPNIYKSGSSCGANAQGGGGFQPGNTCGKEDGAGETQGEAKGKEGKAKPQGAFAKAREAAKADLERIRSEVIKTAEEWAAKIEEAKKVADAEFDKIAGATEPMEKAWKNIKGKTGEEKAEALRLYEAEAAKFDLLRGPANEAQARYRKMQEEARIAVAAVIGKESLALSESLGITDKHEQSVEENSRLHYSLLGVVAEEAKVLKDPSAMKSVTSGRAREARIAATEFLDSMLHPAIHQSALHSEIVYMEHGERASARPVRRGWNEAKQSEDDNKTGFSSIPLDATSSTYIHEYGHQVEFGSQEIRDLTLDFLASRTQGEEIVSLKEKYPDTNYDEWERGAKDGFAKAHEAAGFAPEDAESRAYYAGKSYGTRLTELLPMGLELMHKDAAAFAKADPEWFDLVAGIATGRLLPIAQKRLKDGK